MAYFKAQVPLTLALSFESEGASAAAEFVERCVDEFMEVTARVPWQENLADGDWLALLGSALNRERSDTEIVEVTAEEVDGDAK
jgi:hypothetical protein